MDEKEKLGQLYNAVYEIQYYTEIGIGYLDAHEDIREMNPLTLIFDEIYKRSEIINKYLIDNKASQNHFKT